MFVMVGLDHTTAPLGLRERFAFTAAEIPAALQRLTSFDNPLLEQAVIVSTCNRVELYGAARSRPDERQLASFMALYRGIDPTEVGCSLHVTRGDQVFRRLAETAAGMHSVVLGEAQIQGQIRQALDIALAAGTAGVELRRLFESAVAAGRHVRSGTAIGRGVASVPYASVELARARFGSLSDSTVLLIGAGTVGQLAARQLSNAGAKALLVLSRTPGRAELLAESYGCEVITAERLELALVQSDVVISATGAQQVVLGSELLRNAVTRRSSNSQTLLVFDLSVPRDVDQAAAGLSGVEVHTVDDLGLVVRRGLDKRTAELPEANAILVRESARFTDWLRRREAASPLNASMA